MVSRGICGYLSVSGDIWGDLGVSRGISRYLDHLMVSGSIWGRSESPGPETTRPPWARAAPLGRRVSQIPCAQGGLRAPKGVSGYLEVFQCI